MSVAHDAAKPHHHQDGKTFYFCSEGCHKKFVADPERYLGD
ncbi:MAG: YHS domain-containing protein, partial [Alcaligenaceae bacterium]|nr:YHS domain-containing protein [Alcaligenaceae bacterium]